MGSAAHSPGEFPGGPPILTLSDAEFTQITGFLYERFGLTIEPGKRDLVASKLSKVLKKRGVGSWKDLYEEHIRKGEAAALSELINQMTTNHTFFWREPAHFEYLRRTALPDLAQRLRTSRDLRVWCAAASTGEEPYTLALLLREHFGSAYSTWKAGVLATDISSRALRAAAAGEYEASALQGLPPELRTLGFDVAGERATVRPEVRSDVLFRRFNLMTRPLPFRQPLHIVFCRNVMIYFDAKTNAELSKAIHDALAPGGYLFVGHSEPLDRRWTPLQAVGPAIYRRPL